MYRMRGSKNTIFTLVMIKAGSYLISETIARRRFPLGKPKNEILPWILAYLIEAQKSEH